MTLFNTPAPSDRCKNCIHIYNHQYNNTKYCELQKGKGAYGNKVIKAMDRACPLFEKKNKSNEQ